MSVHELQPSLVLKGRKYISEKERRWGSGKYIIYKGMVNKRDEFVFLRVGLYGVCLKIDDFNCLSLFPVLIFQGFTV